MGCVHLQILGIQFTLFQSKNGSQSLFIAVLHPIFLHKRSRSLMHRKSLKTSQIMPKIGGNFRYC